MKPCIRAQTPWLLLLTGQLATATPIVWAAADGGNGHAYEVVPYRQTWTQCRDHAATQSWNGVVGHLATVASAQENAFIWGNLNARLCWLGGYRQSGTWRWVTGEPFSYTRWYPGEPNNYGGNEYYLQYSPDDGTGKWNDNSSRGRNSGNDVGYIIEYDFVPPPASDYEIWQRGWFGAALDDPAQEDDLWGDNTDPDHDGTVNVLEFVMGRNPLVADNELDPQIRVENGEITFTYPQTTLTNHDVISYVSWSSDLEHWTTGGIVYNVASVNEDTMMIEANLVPHHGDRLFMRLEALRTGGGP